MTRYLALTIGPVFATLQSARSTKALWSASYLFSWIMRETLRELRKIEGLTLLNLPNRDDFFDGKERGVGLFPDRFTAKVTSNFRLEDLKTIVGKVVSHLSQRMEEDIAKHFERKEKDGQKTLLKDAFTSDEISQFLHQYLRLLAVEFELEDDDFNPVKTADAYLNSLELRAAFVQELERDGLRMFFEDLFFNFFIREEFEKAGFPSTLEIATDSFKLHTSNKYIEAVRVLREIDIDPDAPEAQRKQEDFIKAIRSIGGDRFRLCHKYIAIVRADGDHIGNLFKTLLRLDATDKQLDDKRRTRAEQLADALADYSLAAVEAIKEFGGAPVYAGGDDLLFFAPVSVEKKTESGWGRGNIFDLLNTLDGLFREKVADSDLVKSVPKVPDIKLPTMSYGLSVSHHKYPLAESLEKAQSLLFHNIKTGNKRNGIAWQLTKHSGFGFGMVSVKTDESFKIFANLLAQERSKEENSSAFLASVMHKLESLEGLFQATADEPKEHFENIIFNNFNESIHRVEVESDGKKTKELSPFLKQVVALLLACFPENSLPADAERRKKAVRENLDRAYAALRFVHFLETDDKD